MIPGSASDPISTDLPNLDEAYIMNPYAGKDQLTFLEALDLLSVSARSCMLMGSTGTEAVKQQINAEFERRKKSVYGLCVYYAGLVLRHFRTHQMGNTYWENRTILRRIRFSARHSRKAKDMVFCT